MFKLEEFENKLIVEKVEKINKYLIKNKVDKISKVLDEFQRLLDKQEYIVPITYISSVLAEYRIDLISDELLQNIEDFLHSENVKLKINSLIIIGFAMLADSNHFEMYSDEFIKFLLEDSEDIRNNIHFFMPKLVFA